mmetsp:Transcript_4662/g.13608  ORF Transcript_4662/g.13608 Transcript_4662/m.13608 type:complete len:279 (-) Transcript_4662:1789-2625(-)
MVCFSIWHWYMLRGLWLWFEKGVSPARRENICVGCSSSWVKSTGSCSGTSSSRAAAPFSFFFLPRTRSAASFSDLRAEMLMKSCSRGPIHSTCWVSRLRTGRVSRPGARKRNRPGKSLPQCLPMLTISMLSGMPQSPATLCLRSALSAATRRALSMWPSGQPSRRTHRRLLEGPCEGAAHAEPVGSQSSAPMLARTAATASAAPGVGRRTTARAELARWFSRPQGEPSGVCTGQRKPHVSGSSLRTVVVFISAKYWPRCTDAKWELHRNWLSLSATIV